MIVANFHVQMFNTREQLFAAMSAKIALVIKASVKNSLTDSQTNSSTQNIALAGGNTPQDVYRLLQKEDMPWHKMHFYPSDERCTEDASRRNDKMLQQHLGSNAQVFSLQEGESPPPLHFALLGMGEDGHIASLFPELTLSEMQSDSIFAVKTKSTPEPRLTMPLSSFVDAQQVCVLFCGRTKWNALSQPNLPIAALLQERERVGRITEIFYAP